MVKGIAPCLYVRHTHHSGSLVGSSRGNCLPGTVGSHTYTCHTATVHGIVTTVVVKPLLKFLPTLRGISGSKTDIVGYLIPHGTIPLIVPLHPTIIGVVMRLSAKESAVGAASISRYIGNTYSTGHSLRIAGLISQEPRKMRRVLVLGQRSIRIAIAVHLVRKLITNGCSRATGTAILIKDGREILILSVVNERGKLHLTLSSLTTGHIISGLRLGGYIVLKVRKDTSVNLHHLTIRQSIIFYLSHCHNGAHTGNQQEGTRFHVEVMRLKVQKFKSSRVQKFKSSRVQKL